MTSRNAAPNLNDDMRPEYDLSKLKGGVRGKYYQRATAGTTLVLLEPDVAAAFPDARAVNDALRSLLEIARRDIQGTSIAEKLPNPRVQPSRETVRTKRKRPGARG